MLHNGSNPAIKRTAAQQIGEIVKIRPGDMQVLLERILVLLRHKDWSTRVASAQAIEEICVNVPLWDPLPVIITPDDAKKATLPPLQLSFENFDLFAILQKGDPLLASSGGEYEMDLSSAFEGMDKKNRLALQQKQLQQRMGMDFVGDSSFLGEDDLVENQADTRRVAKKNIAAQIGVGTEGLSAREKAMLKRKAKLAKAQPLSASVAGTSEAVSDSSGRILLRPLDGKSAKFHSLDPGAIILSMLASDSTGIESAQTSNKINDTDDGKVIMESNTDDVEGAASFIWSELDEWPFQAICDVLIVDLFDPVWEIRHGAALALREILNRHGATAGKCSVLTVSATEFKAHLDSLEPKDGGALWKQIQLERKLDPQVLAKVIERINNEKTKSWLEDMSIRFMCVFALDRFSDFVGDHVTVPVRETCSQALGVLVKSMTDRTSIHGLINEGLLALCDTGRISKAINALPTSGRIHSALKFSAVLALKYVLATRKDLISELFQYPALTNLLTGGLSDADDDIRAVVASTLVPIVDEISAVWSRDQLATVEALLWNGLSDLDDLSSSTSSIMELMACLISRKSVGDFEEEFVESLSAVYLPQLYQFFRHNIASVRAAVLKTTRVLIPVLVREATVDDYQWTAKMLEHLALVLLLEDRHDVIALAFDCWNALFDESSRNASLYDAIERYFVQTRFIARWLFVLTTAIGTALNVGFLPLSGEGFIHRVLKKESAVRHTDHTLTAQDSAMITQDFEVFSRSTVLNCRYNCAKALAVSFANLSLKPTQSSQALMSSVFESLKILSPSPSGSLSFHAFIYSAFLCNWSEQIIRKFPALDATLASLLNVNPLDKRLLFVREFVKAFSADLKSKLDAESSYIFVEDHAAISALRAACVGLLKEITSHSTVDFSTLPTIPGVEGGFNVASAQAILDSWCPALVQQAKPVKAVDFAALVQQVRVKISDMESQLEKSEAFVMSSLASSLVSFGTFLQATPAEETPRLSPIIQALFDGLKLEETDWLQERTARHLASLCKALAYSVLEVGKKAAEKIVAKICSLVCSNPYTTHSLLDRKWQSEQDVIISFPKEEIEIDSVMQESLALVERGGEFALKFLCIEFGDAIFDSNVLALLTTLQADILDSKVTVEAIRKDPGGTGQNLINSLRVLSSCVLHLSLNTLESKILADPRLFASLLNFSQFPWAAVRHAVSVTIASISSVFLQRRLRGNSPMQAIIAHGLPLLGDSTNVYRRLGMAEIVWALIQSLGADIVPYLVFFLVPVLGRLSDQHAGVRVAITRCFASLVRLMPLESSSADPYDLSSDLLVRKKEERLFITQLLDPSKLEAFPLPVKINAELRKYQQDGLNWLAFLNKYRLHGILCDDMGLGKTLQTICIVASDQHLRAVKFARDQSPDSKPLPSLVVCPTSVTGHWRHEILKYADNLKPVVFGGSISDRTIIMEQVQKYNVIILSYETLRNNLAYFESFHFNYCVLDEGHIIKNSKAKITLAVKSIHANHRLLLSGTPIQNNVLELWSLFDFLMPGFLGTEALFIERYSKPILAMKGQGAKLGAASKVAKKKVDTAKVQEAGTLALEQLHKQVLPFLLRRLKEDVLHDLPPKIIQDYYCEMSPLQRMLYDDFVRRQALQISDEVGGNGQKTKAVGGHIFQALQYLRKLVNHPILVAESNTPAMHELVTKMVASDNSTLRDARYAPKLMALKELLLSCGIGAEVSNDKSPEVVEAATTVSPHRALIFCQLKTMLDLVLDMFKTHLPSVSFLRMDGSSDPAKRQDLVFQFNADPSIDVMVLTTNVGGLGLNLTGADTVIFVEHDWNPMKDLQAMDRAHRLGQKRVVNVFRLITKDTIEEKIMGLQRFKMNIANTVINEENSGGGLKNMNSDEILGLFQVNDGGSVAESARSTTTGDNSKKRKLESLTGGVAGLSSEVLAELDTLAAESKDQYEDAFDFDKYLAKIQQ